MVKTNDTKNPDPNIIIRSVSDKVTTTSEGITTTSEVMPSTKFIENPDYDSSKNTNYSIIDLPDMDEKINWKLKIIFCIGCIIGTLYIFMKPKKKDIS